MHKMMQHKNLFKENSSMLSPRQYNKINRNIQNANRAKKRNDIYQNSRNISFSPEPIDELPDKLVTSTPAPKFVKILQRQNAVDNKENAGNIVSNFEHSMENVCTEKTARIAKVACSKDDKMGRQDAFLQRFLNWKEDQKRQKELALQKREKKPFIAVASSGSSHNAIFNATKLCLPQSQHFKPPANLINHMNNSKKKSEPVRRSIYEFKTTPTKKANKNNKCSNDNKDVLQSNILHLQEMTPKVASRPFQITQKKNIVVKSKSEELKVCGELETEVKIKAMSKVNTPIVRQKENCVRSKPSTKPSNSLKPAITTDVDKNDQTERKTKVNTTVVLQDNENCEMSKPSTQATTSVKKAIIGKPTTQLTTSAKKAIVSKPSIQPTSSAKKAIVSKPSIQPTTSVKKAIISKPSTQPTTAAKQAITSKPSTQPTTTVKQTITSKTTPFEVTKTPVTIKAPPLSKAPTFKAPITLSKPAVLPKNNVVKPAASTGAVGKANALIKKPSKQTKLSVCLKAKKTTKLNKAAVHKDLKAKPTENVPSLVTPVTEHSSNGFFTSTQMKSSVNYGKPSQFTNNEVQISAVKATTNEDKTKNEHKPIFNFLRYSITDTSFYATPSQTPKLSLKQSSNKAHVVKKLSMSNAKQTEKKENENVPVMPAKERVEKVKDALKTTVETVDNFQTPPKNTNDEQPTNYLSPFVTVSRGKVNAKTERVKRDSIYLQNPSTPTENEIKAELKPATPTTPIEVRRTLETVRYLRKQLEDEIARLHALCDQWDGYKNENIQRLQEVGGDDMIDVTIGQTKLLTSKKFMQFNGLIERCEAGAIGKGAKDDGSEDTKPISSIDLEGFWSMLGLQIDNVDKRFETLNRWKANDWIDPDEIKIKTKKNLTKVTKTKKSKVAAQPNAGLKEMMRKKQAEMRKKREEEISLAAAAASMVADLETPSISQQKRRSSILSPNTSGSRRTSIIVRDRKYHSQAATIVSIPSPTGRNSLIHTSPLSSLQNHNNSRKDLLKTAIIGADKQRRKSLRLQSTQSSEKMSTPPSAIKSPPTTPTNAFIPAQAPKSILKTPGTSKGKPKNVIFSAKMRVKRFNFLMGDGGEEENTSIKLDSRENSFNNVNKNNNDAAETTTIGERTYKLRNRKVYLRPSCEIVIPREN